MEKLKKFCKLPGLCCAAGLFVILFIALIALSVQDYSHGVYTYEDSMAGVSMKIEMNLKGNNDAVIGTTVKNANGESNYQEMNGKFKVINGEFFTSDDNGVTYEKNGKIDAFELVVEQSGMKMVFMNHGARGTRVVLVILMLLAAGAAAASGVYIVLSKKQHAKLIKASTPAQN